MGFSQIFATKVSWLNLPLNLLRTSLVYRNEREESAAQVKPAAEKRKMNSRILRSFPGWLRQVAVLAACASLVPPAQAQVSRFLGTVTGINGTTLTVKTDKGAVQQVEVPESAVLQRIEPGQRDLSAAVTIKLDDLATGDRVLVKLSPDASGTTPQAAQIITIKSADLAAKQQKEREQWRLQGVGGLVKSVDPASGVIVLTTGAGALTKTITVHVTPKTVLKRYAPASVRYDLAKAAPISEIHVGDQLRARGRKNAAGTEVQADEVVSGGFRNISGRIDSLDAANQTFTVKDLLTKKRVTIQVPTEAQMHALPVMMARALAARLKGEEQNGRGGAMQARMRNAPAEHQESYQPRAGGMESAPNHAENGSAVQTMLNRAPAIQFSDLKKGEAVMVVSTEEANDVTAISLLTGVEPLLEAPEASQNLLSNWSMGSGGAEDAAQ